jgi:hypothetical protein
MNKDTVNLLKECNAGIKMGDNAIKKVLPRVKSKELKHVLEACRNTHANLGDRTHELLKKGGADTKPPHAIASVMSDVKINMKMMIDPTDSAIADVMTDGCNMGVKSLSRYLNQYKDADNRSKEIAKELIASEEYLSTSMRKHL